MSNEEKEIVALETQIPKGYSAATIEVVKQTVFPKATDAQLALYLHKCTSMGTHPLSGMVHPQVYNTKDGPRVVFVTSIDYMRSACDDTGENDGMDEEEFDGILTIETDQGQLEVPEICRVRVYRKNVGRPVVGVARWVEFYPGNARGQMWHKMPHTMLSKCAEAQARRKMFPQKLNKIYAEEEMMQATNENLSSNKPQLTSQPRAVNQPAGNAQAGSAGTAQAAASGPVISPKQEKRLYAIMSKAEVSKDDFLLYLSVKLHRESMAAVCVGHEYDNLCKYLETQPAVFTQWAKKHRAEQAAQQAEQAQDTKPRADHVANIRGLALQAGYDRDDAYAAVLNSRFKLENPDDLAEVDDQTISRITDFFQAEIDKQQQG